MDSASYKKIYDWVYNNVSDYGAGHGQAALQIAADIVIGQLGHFPVSVVDVGCGPNQFLRGLRARTPTHVRLFGLDVVTSKPVPEGVQSIEAMAWDLSQIPKPVGLITSFDVLEHLYPEDVDKTLEAWHKRLNIGGAVLVSVAIQDSVIRGPEGCTLHPTVHDRQWWMDSLGEFFTDITINHHNYITAWKRG